MTDKKSKNRSYFSVDRNRKKRNLLIIIPVIATIAIAFILIASFSAPSLPNNKMLLHNHVNLKVTSNGQPIQVPAQIGIAQVGKPENTLLFGDHSLDKYGMEGMSPLHTHDAKGTIHVESNTIRDYKLGELLDIWKGLGTNGNNIQAIMDNETVSDYRNIILDDGKNITLNIQA